MVKWLKQAFNRKYPKEDTMNIEQIMEAIGKLPPEEKEKLLQSISAKSNPPAESEAEPAPDDAPNAEAAPPDTDADSESDLTGDKAEGVIPPEATPTEPPTAEPAAPAAEAPDMSGQIAQAVTVAMAPVLVKLQELEQKLSEAGREPQAVADPMKKEKLNKVAGIYGG